MTLVSNVPDKPRPSIELLTYQEAAEYLGMGLTSLKGLVRAATIPVYPLGPGGRIKRFKRADLDRYLRSVKPEGR